MSVIPLFLIGATFALGLSLLTVLVLRPHLRRLLAELCGSQGRAGFWQVACTLCIFLVGILAGTVSSGYPHTVAASTQSLFFGLVTQLQSCLFGLLASILFTAWLLMGWIRRYEQGQLPPPRPNQGRSNGRPAAA